MIAFEEVVKAKMPAATFFHVDSNGSTEPSLVGTEQSHLHLPANEGVDGRMLEESARYALAFVRITRDLGLSGIALEDFNEDFYRILGFRPHLYHPDIGGMGCTIGFEADVLNVLSTVIVGRLARHLGMFNEFFTIDPQANTILMGHPGHGEIRVADPATLMVTPDLEFDQTQKRGA